MVQLGILRSKEQFLFIKIDNEMNKETQVLPLQELQKKNLQAFLYSKEHLDSDLQEIFQAESRKIPFRSLEELDLEYNKLVEASAEEDLKLVKKIQSAWTLQNNISLLEELFQVLPHLKKLWPNERTAFFEELWQHLKINLGAIELKLIFNDLETEKNKLIRAMVSGKRTGNPLPATDIEEKIMDHYQGEFTKLFDIVDFNESKGELVAVAQIQSSPVIIMAKVCQLSRLQKAVVQSLIEGLSH